jgi:phosphinothricin acetyltransferase
MRGLFDGGRDSTVRAAEKSDLAAVQSIYTDEVLHGSASFELEPPTLEEITARWASVLSFQLPYLVAIKDDRIAGYAYVLPYRPRPAYRYTLEHSVYVAPAYQRAGLGSLLLQRILSDCQLWGARQMIGIIGDSDNRASIQLHLRAGFEQIGILKDVGWKFGHWLDSVIMQKALGDDRSPPQELIK